MRYVRICLLLSLAVLVFPNSGLGQATDLPTQLWSETADRAVSVLADDQSTSTALEALRAELSDQRSAALEAQDQLKSRVETLESEIGALGPAPADGETELDEIAQLRAALNERLAEAKVPFLEAQAAYERSDGLIGEIDDLIRGRLSDELTSLGPSPVNPLHWPGTATEIAGVGERVDAVFNNALNSEFRRAQYLGRIPFAALLILVGLFLQFVAKPRFVHNLTLEVNAVPAGASTLSRRIPLELARNLLPLFAAIAVIFGIDQLDPRSFATNGPSTILVPMAVMLILSYWLGNAIFSPADSSRAMMELPHGTAARGRRLSVLVAIVLALMLLVRFLVANFELSDATLAILLFPLFLVGGYFLARLSLIIRAQADQHPEENEDDEPALKSATQVIRNGLGRVGLVVAVVSPLLAVIGYLSAATALFAPTIYTFALIGGLVVVYTDFRDSVDYWLEAGEDTSSRSYRRRLRSIPLFGGFVLTCLAVPALALIWGARVSELQEVWIWLRDGVSVGDVRLSVTDLLTFVLVFAIGYTITRMLQAVVRGTVLPRTDFDRGASNAIVSGIGYIGIFLAAVIAISATGLSLSNLAIVAGALSVGIGFGLQTIVSNFVSGIILLVERPIKEGDWIEVAGFSGYVRKISVRSTLIDTFDKASVIVPNSELIAGSVLNWTHSEMTGRVIVPVGVAYGSDPRKVERVLSEIAEAHPMVIRRPAPAVVFMGFGADSMDFEIRAFLRDVNWMLSAKSEMNFAIVERFEAEGIEIPYAQRDVNLRNVDEAAKAFWASKSD